jgi:cell division transport system permease protein
VNFWRNAVVSLSALFVMVVALFVIGASMLTTVFLDATLASVRDKVDVNIYFEPEAPEENILIEKRELEALVEVAKVEYVSREQAIENFRVRHENDYLITQALEEIDNPLGAILTVKAKDPGQFEAIARHIKETQEAAAPGEGIIYSVNYAKNKAVIDKLTGIVRCVERVSFALLVVLLVVAVVITFNTIRLAIYASRDEIAIMRLVGAENAFVRGPFIVEGMMYGVVAAIVSTAVFYPVTLWLRGATEGFYGGVDLFSYYIVNLNNIFLILAGAGIALGALSSWLAVRKYLSV